MALSTITAALNEDGSAILVYRADGWRIISASARTATHVEHKALNRSANWRWSINESEIDLLMAADSTHCPYCGALGLRWYTQEGGQKWGLFRPDPSNPDKQLRHICSEWGRVGAAVPMIAARIAASATTTAVGGAATATITQTQISEAVRKELKSAMPAIVDTVRDVSGIAEQQELLNKAINALDTGSADLVKQLDTQVQQTLASATKHMTTEIEDAIRKAEAGITNRIQREIENRTPKEHVLVIDDRNTGTVTKGPLPAGMAVPNKDANFFMAADAIAQIEAAMKLADQGKWVLVFLTGKHGTGKTSLPRQVAAHRNAPFGLISFGAKSEARGIIGEDKFTPEKGTYFVPGLFPQYTSVPGAVVVLDEFNRVENSKVHGPLFDWLQSGQFTTESGEIFRIAPGTMIFATANEGYDYSGADEVDMAMRGRFFEIRTATPPKAILAKVASAKTGIAEAEALTLLTSLGAKGSEVPEWITPRGLLKTCELISVGLSWRNAVAASFNTLPDNKRNEILAALNTARPHEREDTSYRAW